MQIEDNHRLLIEIISRLGIVETRLDAISKATEDLNNRLEAIEMSYQKSLGIIQFASATMAVGVVMLVTFTNLWIDKKIGDYRRYEIEKVPETQRNQR